MKRLRKLALVTAISGGLTAGAAVSAKAEAVIGITAYCPYTGPGIAVCAGVGVLAHELVQMGNGKRGFGPNGEIMKVLAASEKIVDGNIKGANRESGVIDQIVRGALGISLRDIDKYGLWGGPNSVFRKPRG